MSFRSMFSAVALVLTVSAFPISVAFADTPTTALTSRTIALTVTEGFVPAMIKVKKGEPLTLIVTRKSDDTCAREIVIKDAGIRAKLPLNKPVTVNLTPTKSGELKYSCGMGMVGGVLSVE
jgi:plastocyanin domain-containing protein